jgi:hypothetical protein
METHARAHTRGVVRSVSLCNVWLTETLDYCIRLRVAKIEGDLLRAIVGKDPAKLMLKFGYG